MCAEFFEHPEPNGWEKAGACLRLLRAATRAAAGVEGPMSFELSLFQRRSELASVSAECDRDPCVLQIDSFTRGDYCWNWRVAPTNPEELLLGPASSPRGRQPSSCAIEGFEPFSFLPNEHPRDGVLAGVPRHHALG